MSLILPSEVIGSTSLYGKMFPQGSASGANDREVMNEMMTCLLSDVRAILHNCVFLCFISSCYHFDIIFACSRQYRLLICF